MLRDGDNSRLIMKGSEDWRVKYDTEQFGQLHGRQSFHNPPKQSTLRQSFTAPYPSLSPDSDTNSDRAISRSEVRVKHSHSVDGSIGMPSEPSNLYPIRDGPDVAIMSGDQLKWNLSRPLSISNPAPSPLQDGQTLVDQKGGL